jgi:hypothetical protein
LFANSNERAHVIEQVDEQEGERNFEQAEVLEAVEI